MIRATTNGVMKAYRVNLNKSTLRLNSARDTVLTERYQGTCIADYRFL